MLALTYPHRVSHCRRDRALLYLFYSTLTHQVLFVWQCQHCFLCSPTQHSDPVHQPTVWCVLVVNRTSALTGTGSLASVSYKPFKNKQDTHAQTHNRQLHTNTIQTFKLLLTHTQHMPAPVCPFCACAQPLQLLYIGCCCGKGWQHCQMLIPGSKLYSTQSCCCRLFLQLQIVSSSRTCISKEA